MAKERAGTTGRGKASGKADSAQLRKDPAFMRNLESAIAEEYARSRRKALPAASNPDEATPRDLGPTKGAAPDGFGAAPKRATEANAPNTPRRAPKKAGSAKGGTGREALAKELASLIPELDAEGLAFLIEQARVHLYNMRVAELEAAAEEAERASTRARGLAKTGGIGTKAGTKAGSASDLSIKASGDGSAYDLVYGGKWKLFTGDEMLAMVRIATVKDPQNQVAGRLYRWLLAERSDVINDLGLSGLADPMLKHLVALLRTTFTIKPGR